MAKYRAGVIGLGWMGMLYDLAERIPDLFKVGRRGPADARTGRASPVLPPRSSGKRRESDLVCGSAARPARGRPGGGSRP